MRYFAPAIIPALVVLSACGNPTATTGAAPVTLEQYNAVQTGQTLSEVQAALGSPGSQMSTAEAGGVKTEIWTWQNPDFSNATITFQDGKVLGKAQINLK